MESIWSPENTKLYRFGMNTFTVWKGEPLMLSKMDYPNFVTIRSAYTFGYFLSTFIAWQEVASWNFLVSSIYKDLNIAKNECKHQIVNSKYNHYFKEKRLLRFSVPVILKKCCPLRVVFAADSL